DPAAELEPVAPRSHRRRRLVLGARQAAERAFEERRVEVLRGALDLEAEPALERFEQPVALDLPEKVGDPGWARGLDPRPRHGPQPLLEDLGRRLPKPRTWELPQESFEQGMHDPAPLDRLPGERRRRLVPRLELH